MKEQLHAEYTADHSVAGWREELLFFTNWSFGRFFVLFVYCCCCFVYTCVCIFFFFFSPPLIQACEDSLHSDDPFEVSAVFCVHWKCSDSFLRGVYMHPNYTPHDLSHTVLLWARLFFILDIAQKYAEPTWHSRTCNEMLHLWEKMWVHYFPQAQHIIYSSV